MSCNSITVSTSECSENSIPKIAGVYITKDGTRIYKKSNGELFTYQNDEAGLKALVLVQEYELWKVLFKPQSQRIINIVLITGLVLALAEIIWFVVTKY
jgi:hypothetical protein